MDKIDRIILGDNQFFGVDHLSGEKGSSKEIHFQDVRNIIQVMEWAYELGAQGVMLSTHPRVEEVCNGIRSSRMLKDEFRIYPNIPYVAKYVRDATEKGLVGLIYDVLSRTSISDKFTMLVRGTKNLFKKDFFDMFRTLIDFEMSYFSKLNVRAIFLHNVLVDLIIGLDMNGILEFYADYIANRYGVLPGFGTLNLPILRKKLDACHVENPLIMASFNKKGLYMNPSREAYEDCIRKDDFQLLANGVLASGALKPKEAFDYLFSHSIDLSVVVGASSRNHLEETIGLLKSYH
jgi:hypothetical protein